MKKILILSVSAGQGHVRAAEALRAGTARWFGSEAEARHIDLMDLTPSWFSTAYKGAYLKFVARFPALWGFLYSRTDRDKVEGVMGQMRRRLESQVSKRLLEAIADYEPDILISTHFLPGQVLARWLRRGKLAPRPHWIVVTDFLAHRFWLEPGQTGYFAASEECVFTMKQRGLADERLMVTGIPIMPEFSDAVSRDEARAVFGFEGGRRSILLMGGGEGVGVLKDVAAEMAALPHDFQLAVLAGKNKKLLADLQIMAGNFPAGRLLPLGFTTEMPRLLTAADLVITKPGGLTTCECLALGKPMIAVSPIPGQEEANSDYLMEHGAAFKAMSLPSLMYKISLLLNEPGLLERLGRNAAAIGRPSAARDILATALNL